MISNWTMICRYRQNVWLEWCIYIVLMRITELDNDYIWMDFLKELLLNSVFMWHNIKVYPLHIYFNKYFCNDTLCYLYLDLCLKETLLTAHERTEHTARLRRIPDRQEHLIAAVLGNAFGFSRCAVAHSKVSQKSFFWQKCTEIKPDRKSDTGTA